MSVERYASPTYLTESHVDSLLSGLLVLAQEVAVLQHRVAVLEAERNGNPLPPAGQPTGSEVINRLVDELMAAMRKEGR